MIDQFRVKIFELSGHPVHKEPFADSLLGRGSQAAPQLRIFDKPVQRGGKPFGIAHLNQKSGLPIHNDLTGSTGPRSYGRQAAQSGLEQHHAKRFRAAGQYEQVTCVA